LNSPKIGKKKFSRYHFSFERGGWTLITDLTHMIISFLAFEISSKKNFLNLPQNQKWQKSFPSFFQNYLFFERGGPKLANYLTQQMTSFLTSKILSEKENLEEM